MQKYSYAAFKNILIDWQKQEILLKSFWQTDQEARAINISTVDLIIYVAPTFLARGFLMIKFFKTKGEIAQWKATKKKPVKIDQKTANQKQILSFQKKISFGFSDQIEAMLRDIYNFDTKRRIKIDQFDTLKAMRAVYYRSS